MHLQYFKIIKQNYSYMATQLPWHGAPEHICVSLDRPIHLSPPPKGVGLSHVRDLSCVPEPHVAEHPSHSVQELQPPSIDPDSMGTD